MTYLDPQAVGGLSLQTEQDTSTGETEYDFLSLPPGLQRMTLLLDDVSSNASSVSDIIVQLGDAGGFENSGYVGSVSEYIDSTVPSVQALGDGFAIVPSNQDTKRYVGIMTLTRKNAGSFTWVAEGIFRNTQPSVIHIVGVKSLSAELDRIRLTHSNGTSTFGLGSINLLLEL